MHHGMLLAFLMATATAQEGTETNRDIYDTGFRAKRPAASVSAKTVANRPKYKIARSEPVPVVAAPAKMSPVVGVTLWRLHPSRTADGNGERLLVPDDSGVTVEYVPERIPIDTPLRVGDRVRLSIESPREGYLYVIDRERFNDGALGDPYLLFPAMRLNGGDNRVGPGRLVEIPGQRDKVPAMRVERKDSRHIGEELLILSTSRPVDNLYPGERNRRIPNEVVERLEADMPSDSVRLDLMGDMGAWTAPEKLAGTGEQLLTQEDVMPQSIYASPRDAAARLVRIFLEVQ
jgi:hypothetical protein